MAGQKLDSVYDCAPKRKQTHFSQIYNRYPRLNLALDKAVLNYILEEVSNKFVKSFFFKISIMYLLDINHNDRPIFTVPADHIKETSSLNYAQCTNKSSIYGLRVRGNMESYHFLYF